MLYSFLRSKKGYSFVEVLIVVIILGILVAVGVPVFTAGYRAQAIKDCNNQKTVISSLFSEAMTGMMDSGRPQDKVDFSKVQSDHRTTYPGDGVDGTADDDYVGKDCFVLIQDQDIPGKIAFTIGDIRGGYRDLNTYPDDSDGYKAGCDAGYYLKKKALKDEKFYWHLSNEEIPVCPFADLDNNKTNDDYRYYIFEDGTVMCSCPHCNEE